MKEFNYELFDTLDKKTLQLVTDWTIEIHRELRQSEVNAEMDERKLKCFKKGIQDALGTVGTRIDFLQGKIDKTN